MRLLRGDRDRDAAHRLGDLDRLAAEAARRPPDEDDVALADGVGRPAGEHPVGGGADEHVGGGRGPGEVGRLGEHLVGLDPGELGERPPIRLVAPDPVARGGDRVATRLDPGVLDVPDAAVDDHLVADLDVLDALADLPDDPGGVAAADVEGLGLAGAVPRPDHVDRTPEGGPHVVVVDAGGHHVDEHLALAGPRGGHLLTEALRPDGLREHALGNDAEGRHLAERCDLHRPVQRQGGQPPLGARRGLLGSPRGR